VFIYGHSDKKNDWHIKVRSIYILRESKMLIDKLKVCLVVSLFFLGLCDVSYAGNTPITGEDTPSDSKSVQTAVPDSNTTDVNAVKETTPGQNGGPVKDNTLAGQSTAQDDSNLPAKEVVDSNATQEKTAKTSGLDQKEDSDSKKRKMIAYYIAIGLVVVTIVACLLLRGTLRTRLRVKKTTRIDLADDTFLIVFNWTPKIFYFPTLIASIVAANLMYLYGDGGEDAIWIFESINPEIVGGIWFLIFFLNFLIEEYNITIMAMLMSLVSIGFLFLWLYLGKWVTSFLNLFTHFAVSISATGYLLVSVIGLLTISISWLKGLFYYVTITPNFINLQEGPTESGEQIGKEDYNTRIDTSNFLGRLLGFGKIVITFKDRKRQPITYLVGSIRQKARQLEEIRSKLVVERSD
jgi:hypothetical protein